MQILGFLLFGRYVIFCNNYSSIDAKALAGDNVVEVQQNELSFLTCLVHRNNASLDIQRHLICTGTLITYEDVLTAEHCLTFVRENGFKLIIGSINVYHGDVYYPAWWISFEQWADKHSVPIEYEMNDVAVVRLTEMVSNQIIPAHFCNIDINLLYGQDAILAGWGVLSNNTVPENLHKGTVKIISRDECKRRLSEIVGYDLDIDDVFVCTSAEPRILMQQGDSGGPVLYNNQIVAVNKGICPFSAEYQNSDKINIHFNIKYYVNFILYVKHFY